MASRQNHHRPVCGTSARSVLRLSQNGGFGCHWRGPAIGAGSGSRGPASVFVRGPSGIGTGLRRAQSSRGPKLPRVAPCGIQHLKVYGIVAAAPAERVGSTMSSAHVMSWRCANPFMFNGKLRPKGDFVSAPRLRLPERLGRGKTDRCAVHVIVPVTNRAGKSDRRQARRRAASGAGRAYRGVPVVPGNAGDTRRTAGRLPLRRSGARDPDRPFRQSAPATGDRPDQIAPARQ